jgi:hypothetical protein
MIYAALVVGGPLDGQRFAHGSQQFKCPVQSETPSLFYNTAGNRIEEYAPIVDTVVYQFGPVYIDNTKDLNLWTPAGQTRLETLHRLIEGYAK